SSDRQIRKVDVAEAREDAESKLQLILVAGPGAKIVPLFHPLAGVLVQQEWGVVDWLPRPTL
ncbi:MAG TPA: hypothetical protein VMQ40_01400, partial [Acidimicrobiales bacterium]|nr:hypothetical protein [Acidimicrobiales bacterium]